MPFIEDFWNEYGKEKVTFVGLDQEKEDLTIEEAHEKLLELDKSSHELNSNEEFLRNSIEGRINYLVEIFSREYFEPYKGKHFRARYRADKGSDQFSIICITNNGFWGFETEYLDAQYENFKEKIDEGNIK